MSGSTIPYDLLAELDIDQIGDVEDHALEPYFHALAVRASSGQLRRFLDGPGHESVFDDEEENPALVRRYVSRRVETVRRLRAARADMASALDGILP